MDAHEPASGKRPAGARTAWGGRGRAPGVERRAGGRRGSTAWSSATSAKPAPTSRASAGRLSRSTASSRCRPSAPRPPQACRPSCVRARSCRRSTGSGPIARRPGRRPGTGCGCLSIPARGVRRDLAASRATIAPEGRGLLSRRRRRSSAPLLPALASPPARQPLKPADRIPVRPERATPGAPRSSNAAASPAACARINWPKLKPDGWDCPGLRSISSTSCRNSPVFGPPL
jgi:hypothetical protein